MFAVGHLALGYITGRISSRMLKVNINIPILFVASIASDIDLLIPGIEHRGPTHSLVLLLTVSIPLILIWKKNAIPITLSLISHPLLGDYLTSSNWNQGIQLLFPLSEKWYYGNIEAISPLLAILEITLLGVMLILLTFTEDAKFLFQPSSLNFILLIPIVAALLPVLTHFPIPVPPSLIIPHIFLSIFLSVPILIDFKAKIINSHKPQVTKVYR